MHLNGHGSKNIRFSAISAWNALAYYLCCELMHRWDNLTMEQGNEIFRNLLNDLKKDVKF